MLMNGMPEIIPVTIRSSYSAVVRHCMPEKSPAGTAQDNSAKSQYAARQPIRRLAILIAQFTPQYLADIGFW
jgi:hypothetical protein